MLNARAPFASSSAFGPVVRRRSGALGLQRAAGAGVGRVGGLDQCRRRHLVTDMPDVATASLLIKRPIFACTAFRCEVVTASPVTVTQNCQTLVKSADSFGNIGWLSVCNVNRLRFKYGLSCPSVLMENEFV